MASGVESELEARNCIGVDIGGTHACVAVWHSDRAEVIANDQGTRTTPMTISFDPETDEVLVGEGAVTRMHKNPLGTVFDLKVLLGRKFSHPEVQAIVNSESHPFCLEEAASGNGDVCVRVPHKGESILFSPEEIVAKVLAQLKALAEEFTSATVLSCVLAVPAHFDEEQRGALTVAAGLAGMQVLRVIAEPSAGAIAHNLDVGVKNGIVGEEEEVKEEEETGGDGEEDGGEEDDEEEGGARYVLAVDMGGSSLDINLLQVESGLISVRSSRHDTNLGGREIDRALVDHFAAQFERKHRVDPRGNARARCRLFIACENAKRTLSKSQHGMVDLDSLCEGFDMQGKISRMRFDDLNAALFRGAMQLVDAVLDDAKVESDDVHAVMLLGGTARTPKLQQLLAKRFGDDKITGRGAPDESVAVGCMVQASVMAPAPDAREAILPEIEVTPLTLGIEGAGGVLEPVILRETLLPATGTVAITTHEDGQTSVLVRVLEGERSDAAHNTTLARIALRGLPAKPRGTLRVDVTFSAQRGGGVTVVVSEASSGATAEAVIETDASRYTTRADVDAVVEEALGHADEDDAILERAEALNELHDALSAARNDADAGAANANVESIFEWATANAASATCEELEAKLAEMNLGGEEEEEEDDGGVDSDMD